MQITHLGHSAVLVETDRTRVLIDPGNFSDRWHGLTDLDAVLVTHQHPDHLDPEHAPDLVRANPQAAILVEPSVIEAVPLTGAGALAAGESTTIGNLTIEAVGGQHAIIHRDLPRIGNIGLLLTEADGASFFHPGDALDTAPDGVDLVGIPAYGPWAAMKETVDFARAVSAPQGFCIHDGLLNERGFQLVHERVGAMSDTTMHDLRDGSPLQL